MKMIRLLTVVLALILACGSSVGAQQPVTLKLGTLAPLNSTWMKFFKRAAKEIKQKTNGAVLHKIYGGGTMGDEQALVTKMGTDQIQMAAITAVGLGEVAREILIMQVPGLITSYAQLDKVRNALRARFEAKMLERGFVLLGWGDVGQLYVFSTSEVTTPDQLKNTKMWAWKSDPITRQVAKVVDVRPVPVGVPEVLPSLSTGHIDTVIVSPLACIQLQWCNYLKTRTARSVAVGIGATLVSKKAWERVPAEHQATVKEVWGKWSRALTKAVRKHNDKAATLLAGKGIKDLTVTSAQDNAWQALAKKVQEQLVGKVYDKQLLEKVRGLVGH